MFFVSAAIYWLSPGIALRRLRVVLHTPLLCVAIQTTMHIVKIPIT